MIWSARERWTGSAHVPPRRIELTEQQPPTTGDVPPDYTAPIDPDDDSGFVDLKPDPDPNPQPELPQPVVDQPAEH